MFNALSIHSPSSHRERGHKVDMMEDGGEKARRFRGARPAEPLSTRAARRDAFVRDFPCLRPSHDVRSRVERALSSDRHLG